MQTSLTGKNSDTPKTTMIEVRFTSGEVDRQAKNIDQPVEYARLFMEEPIFYGTQVVDRPEGSVLDEAREPVLFWTRSRQLYRRGVKATGKSITLDKKIHRWENVPSPVWVNDYLAPEEGETVTPFASEDAYVALSMDVDRKDLAGCELAYHLFMILQLVEIPEVETLATRTEENKWEEAESERDDKEFIDNLRRESENQFLSLARTIMLESLRKKRRFFFLSDLDAEDAITVALVRLVEDLRASTAVMLLSPPRERTHKNDAVSFPAEYPFGRFLDSYQEKIVKFLRSITDSARKKLSGIDDRQRKLYVASEAEIEEIEEDSRKKSRDDALNRGGPLAFVIYKEFTRNAKQILTPQFNTMLYERAEFGLTMDEIGLKNRVSKVQVSKNFKTIQKKVGLRAVRSLAGIATVEEYIAMSPKRHQRKKSQQKGKIPASDSSGDETDPV